MPKIMLVTGEASGDEHSAGVVRHIRNQAPEAQVFGMGGARLREAGMDTTVDAQAYASVMGLTEVISSLGRIFQAHRLLCREAAERKPDLAILVDFPDFNLHLAKKLHRLHIPILYFISPQLWAWRRGRIKLIKKYVSKVVPIFPFEESFYHEHNIDAEYLGHPFLDRAELTVGREEWMKQNNLDPARPLVAVLPGSRKSEVEQLLEPVVGAFERVAKGRPGIQAVLPVASSLDADWVRQLLGKKTKVNLVSGQSRECLSFSDVAVVASGTATVEAALAGVPFVVVYKLSPLTFAVGKLLVKGVKHVAMVNLIAGKKVVEELLQHEANAERIALEIEKLLGDAGKRKMMKQELDEVRGRLAFGLAPGEPVTARVAKAALHLASLGPTMRRGCQ
jgi:lipid-A-disaccharide synthase